MGGLLSLTAIFLTGFEAIASGKAGLSAFLLQTITPSVFEIGSFEELSRHAKGGILSAGCLGVLIFRFTLTIEAKLFFVSFEQELFDVWGSSFANLGAEGSSPDDSTNKLVVEEDEDIKLGRESQSSSSTVTSSEGSIRLIRVPSVVVS